MLKALVFDMDGTITHLTLPLEDMRKDTKEYYISKGLPPGLLEPADGISSTTGKARDYFLNNGLTIDEWNTIEAEVDRILSQHEGFAADTATPIEGSLEIVKELRDLGFKLAILTNNGRPALDKIMKQIPLRENFDIIQTRHESPRPKPFPDGLLKIAFDLGVSPSEVVYIGDALIDATAARRAGIEFWGVSTGETAPDVLYDAGASKVFTSLKDVFEAAQSFR
ncbi:MAG: hypothetical protein AM326_05545 [Candidatus Thorarchaeota archaeon SMTZ-45]|nr:MAG: hypothetical protein AM325_03660 [Candidatus Thorarchaeota archaeon SMTZ1-45]KXH77176.1 MAG: hypothetical protein AM326_05545 [Candidatus Thorarchaeota archaeon SMTZ-45]